MIRREVRQELDDEPAECRLDNGLLVAHLSDRYRGGEELVLLSRFLSRICRANRRNEANGNGERECVSNRHAQFPRAASATLQLFVRCFGEPGKSGPTPSFENPTPSFDDISDR